MKTTFNGAEVGDYSATTRYRSLLDGRVSVIDSVDEVSPAFGTGTGRKVRKRVTIVRVTGRRFTGADPAADTAATR